MINTNVLEENSLLGDLLDYLLYRLLLLLLKFDKVVDPSPAPHSHVVVFPVEYVLLFTYRDIYMIV